MYRNIFKRLIDMIGATLLFILLSPLMGLVYVLIRWQMGAPALFCHRRPGLHEQMFTVYKFRTMRPPSTRSGVAVTELERITPLGRILRCTSLDELPQLINVMRGDMSLIGPRPLLEEYLPYYTATEKRRHDVRPGITGLAQVNGRNEVPADERLAMDVEYVDGISLAMDIRIFWQTLWVILFQKGIQLSPADACPDFVVDRRIPPSN
jgi:lipopolysaccharide/colanic/teichoic acid biosynthesis glycosyltransferase